MGKILRWLLLGIGGLLFGVLLLESVLWAGAVFVAATGRELPSGWLTGHRRVLCLGDSNTYGLWLERDQAYPQQLEAVWNETAGEAKIEVLNLGFPGTNSSRLRRDFARMLETFEPDLVIVLIGANDYWTLPVEFDPDYEGEGRRSFLKRHSRAFKLYSILRRDAGIAELEVSFERFGDLEGPPKPPD